MEASGKITMREDRPGTQGPHRPRRRWRVLAALLLPVVLLLGAWLSIPAWGPPLAGRYLPDGWSLIDASLSLPGLQRAAAPVITARGRIAGMQLQFQAEGTEVSYADTAVTIERLSVLVEPGEWAKPGAETADKPFSLEDLALPQLVLPGQLPKVTIATLDLTLRQDGKDQSWQIQGLVLDGSETAAELALGIEEPPFLIEPLDLALSITPERLTLAATSRGALSPLLRFEQQLPVGARGTATMEAGDALAALFVDVNLAAIDPVAISDVLNRSGLPALKAADGALTLEADFSGRERLTPHAVLLGADDVHLVLQGGDLRAAFTASAAREARAWTLTMPGGDLFLTGEWPEVRKTLSESLDAAGLNLPMSGDLALALSLDPQSSGEPALAARLDPEARNALEANASVRFSGDLGPATPFDVQAKELFLTVATLSEPDAFTLATDLDATLGTSSSVTLSAPPLALGATAVDISLKGRFGWPEAGPPTFDGELRDATLQAFSLSHPANTVRLDRLAITGNIAGSPDEFRWAGIAEGTALITAPGDAVAANSLMTASAVRFQGEAQGGAGESTTVSGDGRLDGVLLPDLAVTLDGVDLDLERLELPAVNAEFGALTTGLQATLVDSIYRGIDLDVTATLAGGESLQGAGELLLGFSGALPFEFTAQLDTAEATLTLDQAMLPATAFADTARAAAVTLPEGLVFRDGALVLDGLLSIDAKGLGGAVDVRGERIAFTFGESRFDGLEFSTQISVADVISGNGPLLLELAELAAGLDLLSISTSVAFSGTDVGLLDLDAELLGGSLSSPALRVSAGDLTDSVIRWEGFDLGMLLTFLDVNGLEGEGILDATVPLASKDGQPGIEGAHFAAQGPGRLRYSTGGPASNIGLQALENFEYDSLEGTLDYEPEGGYTIGLELEGRNPELYGGHPIRFRLNLGGAMPALFRSLFVTGNFEEAIIERLRAGEPFLNEPIEESAEDGAADPPENGLEIEPGARHP